MDRKKTTEFLGNLLVSDKFGGFGKYWASEVSIDPWAAKGKPKRVDFMQFIPAGQCSISEIEKGIFVCYEIKSCKQDVYSGNGLNFIGEKNYIVTTMECYKDLLPDMRDGKFYKHLHEVSPDSSGHFGIMVAIPYTSELTDEFENPTELLKDLFEKLGFQRKDLKTVYFNVDTEYESYQDRDKSWKRRFKGYKYNHHMKIEFAADNKRLGQVLYALAHSSLRPEFSIEYTVADVEKCKNELLHKAIEDSIQKAQVLTTAANVKLGEIQAIDYSWGEIDFVTKPLNEMRLMECTECEMSAPGAYDIDIEADDINVTDTATVIWEIA